MPGMEDSGKCWIERKWTATVPLDRRRRIPFIPQGINYWTSGGPLGYPIGVGEGVQCNPLNLILNLTLVLVFCNLHFES